MKQFAIIGVGNFGHYLATHLYEKGHEVLVVDKSQSKVQEIKDRVSQAVVADATDPVALQPLGLEQMDTVVVSMGSILANSILATLNVKDLGAGNVVAKALNEQHGRILKKVGASEIIFPEKDVGISLAERLHNPNMLDYLPFIEGFRIIQLSPPKKFVGKTLVDLNLINRYGIQVVAIKETVPNRFNYIPTGGYVVKESDILILLGPDEALDKFSRKVS